MVYFLGTLFSHDFDDTLGWIYFAILIKKIVFDFLIFSHRILRPSGRKCRKWDSWSILSRILRRLQLWYSRARNFRIFYKIIWVSTWNCTLVRAYKGLGCKHQNHDIAREQWGKHGHQWAGKGTQTTGNRAARSTLHHNTNESIIPLPMCT